MSTRTILAGDYLRLIRERGPVLASEVLRAIDAAKRAESPPVDKWKGN